MKNFLKWAMGVIGSALVTLFLYILLKIIRDRAVASISGSTVDPIVNAFAAPLKWANGLIPDLSKTQAPSDFTKWKFIFFSGVLELISLAGIFFFLALAIYFIYKAYTGRDPIFGSDSEWVASTEMAAAVSAVDENPESELTLKSMDEFLEAFDSGIASLFGLKAHEYRGYWLIPDAAAGMESGYQTVSTARHLDENDIHIIESALKHPGKKSYADRPNSVPGRYDNYDVDHVLFCRNKGNFRLGYILFVHKIDAISDKAQQKFFNATSSLLYLGYVDKFPEIMLKLKQEP